MGNPATNSKTPVKIIPPRQRNDAHDGILLSPKSSSSLKEREKKPKIGKLFHRQDMAENDFDSNGEIFSVPLKDDDGRGRTRTLKQKQKQNLPNTDLGLDDEYEGNGEFEKDGPVAQTLHSYKLEEWMTSSEEDESSDMISEDYSREQQRESFIGIQQEGEDEGIINMTIVFGQRSDFSVGNEEDDDRDDWSSLSSYNSLTERGSGMNDILSEGEQGISYELCDLLGASHRTIGLAFDHKFYFSPARTPPTVSAAASPENQPQVLHTSQGPNHFAFVDELDGDHSENDGDVDDSKRKYDSKRSIEISPMRRKSPRKALGFSHSPQDKGSRKGRSKGRRVTPFWSPEHSPRVFDEAKPIKSFPDIETVDTGEIHGSQQEYRSSDDATKSPLIKKLNQEHESTFESRTWSSPKDGRSSHTMDSSPDDVFSPESQSRTFLPKIFRHGTDANVMHPSFKPSRDEIAVSQRRSSTHSSDVSSISTLYSDIQYDNGQRPAFVSDVEYSAPLVDKSELPTMKTKKSLNRKRSITPNSKLVTSQEERAHNNGLLDTLLSSSLESESTHRSLMDELDHTVASNRMRSISVGYDPFDDVSISRSSVARSVSRMSTDDCDDHSVMSEISADSIHRNVQVKRTTRKKKIKKEKATSNAEDVPGLAGSGNANVGGSCVSKKKKAQKKARPKKRGRKEDYQQNPGDSTHENKSNPGPELNCPANSNRKIDERIDAIFNNKDLIYSDLEKKLSAMSSETKTDIQDDIAREKAKSMRVKSKALLDPPVSEKCPTSLGLLDRSLSQHRSRSHSTSQDHSAQNLETLSEGRIRTMSIDSSGVDHKAQSTRMRGKKVIVVGGQSSESESLSAPKHEMTSIATGDHTTIFSERPYHTASMAKGAVSRTSNVGGSEHFLNGSSAVVSDSGSSISPTSLSNQRRRGRLRGEEEKKGISVARATTLPFEMKEKKQPSPSSFGTLRAKLSSADFHNRDRVSEASQSLDTKQSSENGDSSGDPLRDPPPKQSQLEEMKASKDQGKSTTKEGRDGKNTTAANVKDLKLQSTKWKTLKEDSCCSPLPKHAMASPTGSKKRSPKVPSGRTVDKDIEEALQRHNLGSAVSNYILGSAISTPNLKSKKDFKKSKRQLEKRRSTLEGLATNIPLATKERHIGNLNDTATEISRSLSTYGSNHSHEMRSAVEGNDNIGDKFCESKIERLRLEVKRKKKQMKQQISEMRSQTEEDILNMEKDFEYEKIALGQMLESFGDDSNPAERLKYLCSSKVARLHEEGKSLRKQIELLQSDVASEFALTSELVRESLDIQTKTKELIAEISRVELENARHASSVNALRIIHKSLSTLLEDDEARYQEDAKSFVSNFIPNLEETQYMPLKRRLREFDGRG
ncbi:hypothetical protein IV203_001123 [Nitzschia inconspicua]|uniref:Uncharacterized protein n=1 Tax=Nitzschia inconspicua TaxID=303405 RepID=A0A9K3L6M5_9STRA|nr:hypothetical protein IV203_001123 [Nitzschia inconspicua]